MSRKDMLQALLAGRGSGLPTGNSTNEAPKRDGEGVPVRAGAVGAMGRALGKINDAAQEARQEARTLIATGETVLSLDPALIESSFVSDRLDTNDEDHRSLSASIRDHGQQVPILVRPHPRRPGHYQAAYGHRRLRAARDLQRPVRAVVREMSDAELLIAQGQENSARLDLSYIERALFAVAIEAQGIDRAAIMAALSVEKTQLSRLIAIGRAVPGEIIRLIGPAPRTGRPRWATLVEELANKDHAPVVARLSADAEFLAADSDTRFARFLSALAGAGEGAASFRPWQDGEGKEIARYREGSGKFTLVLDDRQAPDFGSFLVGELDKLYQRYRSQSARRSSSKTQR